jgi:hypothetical protein
MGKSAYKDANAPQCYVIHTSPVWLINVENILTFQIVYTVSEYIYIYLTVSVGQNLYMKIVGILGTQFGSYPDVANNVCTLLIQQIYTIKIM